MQCTSTRLGYLTVTLKPDILVERGEKDVIPLMVPAAIFLIAAHEFNQSYKNKLI